MELKLPMLAICIVLSSAALAQELIDPSLSRGYAESASIPPNPNVAAPEGKSTGDKASTARGPAVSYTLRSDQALPHPESQPKAAKYTKKASGKRVAGRSAGSKKASSKKTQVRNRTKATRTKSRKN